MLDPLIPILVASVLFAGLWLWSLIHWIMNNRLSDTNRLIGILLIAILGLLGSLIYVFLPRNPATSRYGTRSISRGQRGHTPTRTTRSAGAGSALRTARSIRR